MRYIPIDNLKPGQKLASDLFFNRNSILLRKGITLTNSLIRKVKFLGFQGLYIDDELSKGIYIDNIVSPELKMQTKKELQSLLYSAKNKVNVKLKVHLNTIKKSSIRYCRRGPAASSNYGKYH